MWDDYMSTDNTTVAYALPKTLDLRANNHKNTLAKSSRYVDC